MTLKDYYKMVSERWEKIDKNNREAIHRFNEWKRKLRKMINED